MQPIGMPRSNYLGPARVQVGQHRQVVRAGFAREGGQIVVGVYPDEAQTELGEQRALIIQLALHAQPGALPILGDPRIHHPGRPVRPGQRTKVRQQPGRQLQGGQS